MADLTADLSRRIAAVAADRESGASEILVHVLAILTDALTAGLPIEPIARALCHAQPSMASVWNAALAASAADDRAVTRLRRFAEQVARAPTAIARFAVECLATREDGSTKPSQGTESPTAEPPLRLVTISFSGSVLGVVDALRQTRVLRMACSESRPALEGRRFAARVAAMGVPVTCFGDAAIAHALASADAVIVGADAVGPEWFLNKSGTRMLAAAASQQGVPTYVIASRDKFVSHELGTRLLGREGSAAEIWDEPPAGVTVRNPYFESIPLDLVTAVISDVGVLGADMVPDVCQAVAGELGGSVAG